MGIDLSDGIRPRHLVAFLVLVLMSSGYAGAMSALQPGLLQIMGVEPAAQAEITGYLGATQEIVMILTMAVFGVAPTVSAPPAVRFRISGHRGRFRPYPFAGSVAELAAYRVIVAVGGGAMFCMMVVIISDYTRDSTPGPSIQWFCGFVRCSAPSCRPLSPDCPRPLSPAAHRKSTPSPDLRRRGGALRHCRDSRRHWTGAADRTVVQGGGKELVGLLRDGAAAAPSPASRCPMVRRLSPGATLR